MAQDNKLYGISNNTEKELLTIEDVASFICEEGAHSDVSIYRTDCSLLLNTFGIFINKITDAEYRDKLLEVLIPMQRQIEDNMTSSDEGISMGGM